MPVLFLVFGAEPGVNRWGLMVNGWPSGAFHAPPRMNGSLAFAASAGTSTVVSCVTIAKHQCTISMADRSVRKDLVGLCSICVNRARV